MTVAGPDGARTAAAPITIGVLALQGAFVEHVKLLHHVSATVAVHVDVQEVRTPGDLALCDALIIPGGESTAISLIAERTGLLEPLRHFVKVQRRPTWGTCAGLILLAESANQSKATGQELIGGLDVRVQRNHFGRQVESFEADLDLPFLADVAGGDGAGNGNGGGGGGSGSGGERAPAPFHSVFIRAPVVEKVLPPPPATTTPAAAKPAVEILGRLPARATAVRDPATTAADLGEDGAIIAVKQGHVFATAFHPELTRDARIHQWWLTQVIEAVAATRAAAAAAAAGKE